MRLNRSIRSHVKKYRHTYSFSDFFLYFCFVSHVKRYTCTLISSLHRLWLTRTKAHRAAEALVHESSDTSGTLSGAKRSGNAFTAEQKRSDHTCEYFFPKNLFVGGKFTSEIFKLLLKRYAIKTHVKHTHTTHINERKRGRERFTRLSSFFSLSLALCLSFFVCDLRVGESVRNFKFR